MTDTHTWKNWDGHGSILILHLSEPRHDPPAVLDVSIHTGKLRMTLDGFETTRAVTELEQKSYRIRPSVDITPEFQVRIAVRAEHGVSFIDVMNAIEKAKEDLLKK